MSCWTIIQHYFTLDGGLAVGTAGVSDATMLFGNISIGQRCSDTFEFRQVPLPTSIRRSAWSTQNTVISESMTMTGNSKRLTMCLLQPALISAP